MIDIIHPARKTLLFDDSGKRSELVILCLNGQLDSAQVCEFIGLYLLNKIKPLLGFSNVCFHRGNGLATVRKANGPKLDRLRKYIVSLFKDEGLFIAIDTNLIETYFVDASFNLNTRKYFPFKKWNNASLYIHSKSNHPSSIIKQLQSITNKLISNLPCDETECNKTKITYKTPFKNSGYHPRIQEKIEIGS